MEGKSTWRWQKSRAVTGVEERVPEILVTDELTFVFVEGKTRDSKAFVPLVASLTEAAVDVEAFVVVTNAALPVANTPFPPIDVTELARFAREVAWTTTDETELD